MLLYFDVSETHTLSCILLCFLSRIGKDQDVSVEAEGISVGDQKSERQRRRGRLVVSFLDLRPCSAEFAQPHGPERRGNDV